MKNLRKIGSRSELFVSRCSAGLICDRSSGRSFSSSSSQSAGLAGRDSVVSVDSVALTRVSSVAVVGAKVNVFSLPRLRTSNY